MKSDRQLSRRILFDKKRQVWTFSIACVPDLTAEEIAERSEIIRRYPRMRVATAGVLQDAGFPVESDGKHKTHGVIIFAEEPDATVWDRLRDLMPVRINPHYPG